MSRPGIMVDLDGTLALIGDRSPYDADLCGLDKVCEEVRQIMAWAEAAGWAVVLVSGRGFKASHRKATEDWLFWNDISYDHLAMREPGDNRPDHVVKAELYRREIEGSWDIKITLDDRKSVVVTWRGLGLFTLQAADRLDQEQEQEVVRLRAEVERLTKLVESHQRVELRLAREAQEAPSAPPRGGPAGGSTMAKPTRLSVNITDSVARDVEYLKGAWGLNLTDTVNQVVSRAAGLQRQDARFEVVLRERATGDIYARKGEE